MILTNLILPVTKRTTNFSLSICPYVFFTLLFYILNLKIFLLNLPLLFCVFTLFEEDHSDNSLRGYQFSLKGKGSKSSNLKEMRNLGEKNSTSLLLLISWHKGREELKILTL